MKRVLASFGFWVRHESVLPMGIDYQRDIARMAAVLGRHVRVFFDVGANTGQTSRAALDSFPGARILSFEPDAQTFAALTTTVRDSRAQCYNLAMSDRSGTADFFDYGPLATSNSLVPDAQYAVRSQGQPTIRTVECETLDDFCLRNDVTHIDVLKVDTEGHDLAVLRGASRLLREHRIDFVYVEFNSLFPKEGNTGGALAPIGELLEDAGFTMVATYPEYMITEGRLFVVQNALFVLVDD